MALNSRPALHPKWVYHNRSVPAGFQTCAVAIYDQTLSGRTYDAATNTWGGAATEIWSGNARIQPLSNATERTVMTNDTVTRQVQIEISFEGDTMADIRPGNYLLVTSSKYDANLTKFSYIVRSVINSSNPWLRTLVCDVDMEADPDA